MLYIIGIGLGNEKDLTLNALEVIKNSSHVYLENYTSKLFFNIEDLEKLTNKKVILADREVVEIKDEIIQNSIKNDVCLLVKGDVLSATTHIDIYLRAKEKNVEVKLIHNSSILTAVGDCGLSLYKFGKTASIPFNNDKVETPYNILKENKEIHTLILLDLNPKENKYMSINEALNYLLKVENNRKENLIAKDKKIVICCALGTDEQLIVYNTIEELMKKDFNIFPQCLVIPGTLHFMEEEMLNLFK